MQLDGKRALVTGGSGDLGRCIALELAKQGVHVAFTSTSEGARSESTRDAVQALGVQALALTLDQRDPASIDAMAARLRSEWGGVDLLVNNAAWNTGIRFEDLDALDAAIWDRIMETNVRGPYLLSRALAPELKASGHGRIVNIASIGGISPASSSIAYSASKAALIHLTKCLAVAMAPQVAVNCVAPGLVSGTRMSERTPRTVTDAARAQAVLGRVASADDIARQVAAFCAMDSVTGQTVTVDGGMPANMR